MDETTKNIKIGKSVIYVNYSPYENSGHILDYLLENFERVYLFSIAFNTLGGKKTLNKLLIYQNRKLISEQNLFYMNIPQLLVFFLIPIRSLMNAFQIYTKTISIKAKYGKIDIFFTVNAFTAVVGMVLRKLALVKETVFWVWDYYPIKHTNALKRTMRWFYWQFDKLATSADKVVYLTHRLAEIRVKARVISKNTKIQIIPIGMGKMLPIKRKNIHNIKIVFIGVLKKSQGLDMLMDCAGDLASNFHNISFEIIGSGPDENYFRKKSRKLPIKFKFYGYISENRYKQILYNSVIGIAPYKPEGNNVSRYGDPSKIKSYLEYNLPSITTDVFEFSKELKKSGAGAVIDYNNTSSLIEAINNIITDYDRYVNNAQKLHKKYFYNKIYPKMFEIL